MLLSLQRFHRLYSVLYGPSAAGALRHRKLLRLMNIMQLNTRLSSARVSLWDLGKKGSRRVIWASLNQTRIDMFTARFFGP